MVWILVVLMVVPDGFDYSSLPTLNAPDSGSALSRLLWLTLLGAGLFDIARRKRLAYLLLGWLNPFLIAFLILTIASVAWSIDPGLTIRRDLRIVTFAVVSFAAALSNWHRHRFQDAVRPILTAILAGSILFGLVFPLYAIHQETSPELLGAWRGLTNHKNTLGALACMGLIFSVHAWLTKGTKSLTAAFGTLIAATCIILSRSSTSLMTGVLSVLFLLLFLRTSPRMRRFMPLTVSIFVVILLTYSMAMLRLVPGLEILLEPIAVLTGKDLTFTGRAEIWAIITEHIQLHPMLGTGYGAYWSQQPGSPSLEVLERLYFYPGSAHNGYLDIVNDLGVVGLAALVGYILLYVRHSLGLLESDRRQSALFLALFLQQGLTNLSESHWLSAMSVNCVVMILATAALARSHLDLRLQQFFGDPLLAAAPPAPTTTIALNTVRPP